MRAIHELKRLNYRNATDCASVIRATSKLQAMCHAKQRLKKYTIFSLVHYRVCYLEKYFFGPSRKAFNLRFCPVYITVTSSPSVLEWAWHKHQVLSRISGGFGLVSWTKHLFHVWQLYKMDSFFIFFLTETCEQHKESLFGIITFCLFFPTRFVSGWDFCRNDYN